MAVRLNFKNEVIARQAMNDCWNLGYWGYILHWGCRSGAACILEFAEDMYGTIRLRYESDILD